LRAEFGVRSRSRGATTSESDHSLW